MWPMVRMGESDMPRYAAEALIRTRITSCRACPGVRGGPVPWSGGTPSGIVVVGEAPGADEVVSGRPFVGRAGRLLRRLLSEEGLDPTSILFMNVACCRPPSGPPTVEMERNCRVHFTSQLRLAEPRWVLAVGRVAAGAFDITGPVEMARRRIWQHDLVGNGVVVTYHPAAVLRNPHLEPTVRADLAWLVSLIIGGGRDVDRATGEG